MKKYYKQSGSVLFPTPSSFQKRDPRIDDARFDAADRLTEENPELKEDIKNDAADTLIDNPIYSPIAPDRNPTPEPQLHRDEIPIDRNHYEVDQFDKKTNMDDAIDNDNLREFLTRGFKNPDDINLVDQILRRLRSFYANNSDVADEMKRKTGDVAHLSWDPGLQQDFIEPGRR